MLVWNARKVRKINGEISQRVSNGSEVKGMK